jgi:hypothetical membrane protein
MERAPRWALCSSIAAPILLIGGWTLAAARQPASFDACVDTISALAAHGAQDRWLMTTALAGLGLCHVISACGLRAAAKPGRWVLAFGGVCTLLVAAFPLGPGGSPRAHLAVAAAAFGALAAWPLFAFRTQPGTALGLRRHVSIAGATLLFALIAAFAQQLYGGGAQIGLFERAVAGAEALWPCFVVLTTQTQTQRVHTA